MFTLSTNDKIVTKKVVQLASYFYDNVDFHSVWTTCKIFSNFTRKNNIPKKSVMGNKAASLLDNKTLQQR